MPKKRSEYKMSDGLATYLNDMTPEQKKIYDKMKARYDACKDYHEKAQLLVDIFLVDSVDVDDKSLLTEDEGVAFDALIKAAAEPKTPHGSFNIEEFIGVQIEVEKIRVQTQIAAGVEYAFEKANLDNLKPDIHDRLRENYALQKMYASSNGAVLNHMGQLRNRLSGGGAARQYVLNQEGITDPKLIKDKGKREEAESRYNKAMRDMIKTPISEGAEAYLNNIKNTNEHAGFYYDAGGSNTKSLKIKEEDASGAVHQVVLKQEDIMGPNEARALSDQNALVQIKRIKESDFKPFWLSEKEAHSWEVRVNKAYEQKSREVSSMDYSLSMDKIKDLVKIHEKLEASGAGKAGFTSAKNALGKFVQEAQPYLNGEKKLDWEGKNKLGNILADFNSKSARYLSDKATFRWTSSGNAHYNLMISGLNIINENAAEGYAREANAARTFRKVNLDTLQKQMGIGKYREREDKVDREDLEKFKTERASKLAGGEQTVRASMNP